MELHLYLGEVIAIELKYMHLGLDNPQRVMLVPLLRGILLMLLQLHLIIASGS